MLRRQRKDTEGYKDYSDKWWNHPLLDACFMEACCWWPLIGLVVILGVAGLLAHLLL